MYIGDRAPIVTMGALKLNNFNQVTEEPAAAEH